MNWTKLQNSIALTMRHIGLTEDETATLMCGLETERQQWMMLDWMDAYYDETGAFPKEQSIVKALSLIRQLTESGQADNREQDSPSP